MQIYETLKSNEKEKLMKKQKGALKLVMATLAFASVTFIGGINVVKADNILAEGTTTAQVTEPETTAPTLNFNTKNSKLSPAKAKVILLDPGHCKIHIGARANGVKEENVNLDIAKSCRDYLNNYSDITVYMTRTNGNCVANLGLGGCLTARNHLAERLGADFLVSMHINSSESINNHGALALVAYKSGYNNALAKQTQSMGNDILKNLENIGMTNGGFLIRKLKKPRYKNGAKSDYYSIVREGVYNGIPSIIMEHGFVTNKSDRNKFFKTATKRKKLGVADAKGIIQNFGLKEKNISGKIKKIKKKKYFVTKTDRRVLGWVKKNGSWYHFNTETGVMDTGFIVDDNKTYYLNPKNGKLTYGWFTIDNKEYLAKGNGEVVFNTIYSDGVKSYYFNKKGYRKNGWVTYKGVTYYFSKKNGMFKGKHKIKGKTYYFYKTSGKLKGKR